MELGTILTIIAQVLEWLCELIVLVLPWMILGAIKAVKKSVDDASARRTYEAQKIISALNTLHGDLYALGNSGEEVVEE